MKVMFMDSVEGRVDYSHSIPSENGESQNRALMSRAKRKLSTVHLKEEVIFLKELESLLQEEEHSRDHASH